MNNGNTLTQKQIDFARLIFEGKTQRESWIEAGYSSKYVVAVIDSNACRLANSSKIKARIDALNAQRDKAAVLNVDERQVKLTEVVSKADLEYSTPSDAIRAIQELNKMDKIYDIGTVVNVDNRQVIFQGVDKETQKLIEELGGEKERNEQARRGIV